MQYPVRRMGAVGVLCVALVLLAACGGDKDDAGPTATVPQPTTTLDPYAVPDVIDEPYVNRVLAGLDQSFGDVVRLVVSTRSVSTDVIERLGALYVGDVLEFKKNQFRFDLTTDFENYSASPGNYLSTVIELISASERCIFAAIERDYTQVADDPATGSRNQWIALRRSDHPPNTLNPTAWIYTYDGFERGRLAPPNPCAN